MNVPTRTTVTPSPDKGRAGEGFGRCGTTHNPPRSPLVRGEAVLPRTPERGFMQLPWVHAWGTTARPHWRYNPHPFSARLCAGFHTPNPFHPGEAMRDALFESSITSLPLIARGKVRDIYGIDDKHMLIITTDRLSAFDVILPDPIPAKGRVLTAVSNFWFAKLADVVPNHLTGIDPETVVKGDDERAQVRGRAIVVKRLKPLPIEAVVRGYLIGSGWKDYQATDAVCGIQLPHGLKLASRLPQPIFTPATKAAVGDHDENIDFDTTVKMIGAPLAARVRDTSIHLYQRAADYAATRGIIIADTKFEFGLDDEGTLILIDEALTPDSSRFWPADGYKQGISPPSFDKQFVRDYLETLDWDKCAPGPKLPADILEKTSAKYREACERITGRALD